MPTRSTPRAGRTSSRFIRERALVQDAKKCFYVYKQIWGEHVQIGLVAGASCQDYQDDVIKKHELTREDKERDRQRHIETLNAQTGPVFLTYKRSRAIDKLIEQAMAGEAENDFSTYDGVRHIFYVVDDEKLIAGHPEGIPQAGRPVCRRRPPPLGRRHQDQGQAPGSEPGPQRRRGVQLFPGRHLPRQPDEDPALQPPGQGPERHEPGRFPRPRLRALQLRGDRGKGAVQAAGVLPCTSRGKWYRLRAKPGTFDAADAIASLDVSILQNNLLAPVLGIQRSAHRQAHRFRRRHPRHGELEKKVDSGKFAVAFSLRPTTIEQLFAVADAGKIMPPKSTWFEPKLKDGLVSHLFG